MSNQRRIRIRWDRIGASVLAVLINILQLVSQNYTALVWSVVATIFMVLYFREQDDCMNAKETAVRLAIIIKSITEGDDDGDTETQP
jgi:hypothetical protein